MTKKGIIPGMLLTFVLLFASQAFAQDFYLGVKFGLSFQKIEFKDMTVDFENESDTIYGFRLGTRLSNIGLETNYFQANNFLRPTGPTTPEMEIEQFKLSYIGFNLLYYIRIPIVHPYLTAGYGAYRVDLVGLDKDSSGGFNVGIGANFRLQRYVSISAEGKYHWVSFDLIQTRMDLDDITWNISVNFHI